MSMKIRAQLKGKKIRSKMSILLNKRIKIQAMIIPSSPSLFWTTACH